MKKIFEMSYGKEQENSLPSVLQVDSRGRLATGGGSDGAELREAQEE